MSHAIALSRSAWYAEGLRWIGSLFIDAGNALDQARQHAGQPLEPELKARPIDEFLYDTRFRMQMRHF